MCAAKNDTSIVIVKTILSALGFNEAADGLEILHNLSSNLIFKNQDSKEVFKENLRKGISAIINAENIDSNVLEMVNDTFAEYFHEDDLIKYYDKKDKLVKNLLENWGNSSTIGKDYEAFEKLIRSIIISLYDNIYEFTKTGKLISILLKDTTEIKGKASETNENVKQVLTTVKNIEAAVSSSSDTVQTRNLTFVDDNGEYFLNYSRPMFMENAFNDDKKASLENMFIEPILENYDTTLLTALKEWSSSYIKNQFFYYMVKLESEKVVLLRT